MTELTALECARRILELIQEDFKVPNPAKGDPDCADLIVVDSAGHDRFLIQITDLQAGVEGNQHDCLFHD